VVGWCGLGLATTLMAFMLEVWRRAAVTPEVVVWVQDACRDSFLFFIKWMHMHDMK